MKDLLPCPFCGQEVAVRESLNHLAGNGTVYIYCCVEMSEGFVLDEYSQKKQDTKEASVITLTSRWNKRFDRN